MSMSEEEVQYLHETVETIKSKMAAKVVVDVNTMRLYVIVGDKFGDLEKIRHTLTGPEKELAKLKPMIVEANEMLEQYRINFGALPPEVGTFYKQ